MMTRALVSCPKLADGGEPEAVPERPELGSWSPGPLVICKKEICSARRLVLSCDGCPGSCEPAPHLCRQRASDEDMGERGTLSCAAVMRASMIGCICAVDVP